MCVWIFCPHLHPSMNFNPPGPGPNALLTQATEVYDVFGNRVEEDVWTSSGTTVERFAYVGGSVKDIHRSLLSMTPWLVGWWPMRTMGFHQTAMSPFRV